MSDVKQVKVDNWGIYFLQRLKHFFNRTDYCDLTLQFQDNAQLKVHRLVLNACTEYFEILERTCEMYEDCLVMPDDLQADVVVPIVNFMYTGQLEFKMDILEKLYQTSVIMNMPVLTKLLDSHRKKQTTNLYGKRYSRNTELPKQPATPTVAINAQPKKRTFIKAFDNVAEPQVIKKVTKQDTPHNNGLFSTETPPTPKNTVKDPKPTRYELPAELDDDNIFDNSFTSISYTSKPLMVHPETTKYYSPKKNRIFDEPSGSNRFLSGTSTMDIVECRKISSNDIFLDNMSDSHMDTDQPCVKEKKDASQLFDQILINDGPKVSIETKDTKQASNLDHAKIISEVLKKYPHLVQSKKNIKLKILNTPSKSKKVETKSSSRIKVEMPDFTYETDVVDSKVAARLIALGAENIKGPWICLICGTPGRALHFTTYYNYRRHLVEVHNEKPVSNICEYCGLKSLKRNYLLHHMYTKHGVEPPPNIHFPKCNLCSYVALTDAFLVKHKLSHTENQHFRCTVCAATFYSSRLLLQHIQNTGHKYSGEKKPTPQCIYCFKYFSRDSNLYAHLKAHHYQSAKNDGIIDDSDEEKIFTKLSNESIKNEQSPKYIEVEIPSYENQYENNSFQLEQNADGNIELTKKKPRVLTPIAKNKILNPGFSKSQVTNNNPKGNIVRNITKNEFLQSPVSNKKEEIILIDNNEYILQDFQLIPKTDRQNTSFLTNTYHTESVETLPTITTEPEYSNAQTNTEQSKVIFKKSSNLNQPIQIVVSNEEEYKALLSSNHSIIFDSGEADKSMTVLSAPTTVENSIDLNTSQANDMMIIRENYPINITEPNPAENSNIVVVYSHPVDDPNKQYQIITTSQSMEAQYVQPSAIITQNFETVTTSTALIDTQGVTSSVIENAWQGHTQQNTESVVKTSDIPLATHPNVITEHNESNVELSELPDVTITQQVEEEVHMVEEVPSSEVTVVTQNNEEVNTNEESHLQPLVEVLPVTTFETTVAVPADTISTISNTDEPMVVDSYKEIVDEIQTDHKTDIAIQEQDDNVKELTGAMDVSMNEEIKTEANNHDPTDTNIGLVESSSPCPEADQNEIRKEVIMEVQKVNEAPVILEHKDEEIAHIENIIEETNKNDDEETIENIARDIGVDPDTLIPTIGKSLANEKPVIKEIASLTSEWSEDEADGAPDIVSDTKAESTAIPPPSETIQDEQCEISETNETPSDIKEIENNIQNQATESTSVNETEMSSAELKEETASEDGRAPQEKISSLLNDWEDNDSQEEINNADITAIPTEVIKNTTDVVNETVSANSIPKPDIRNLVSDWDEDDDEESKG